MRIALSASSWRRRLAKVCMWLAVATIVAAAAQPSVPVRSTGGGSILELVIDVSNSTMAEDISPTRLAAIQQAVLHLLDEIPPDVRVGLVSFSATVRTLARPTTDRAKVEAEIAALQPDMATAIGDALVAAHADLRASPPQDRARILLISDGANTAGGSPLTAARALGNERIPIFAVAVGKPTGTIRVPDASGNLLDVPVLPDPAELTRIAGSSGGSAVTASSAPELEQALDDLLQRTGLRREWRDLSLLFVAVALLALALARALATSPRWAPSGGMAGRSPKPRWRLVVPVALLAGAGVLAAAWGQWLPTGPPPTVADAVLAKLATQPLPRVPPADPVAIPPPAPPIVSISATTADRRLVEQATRLLRAHGALAPQRTRAIKRQHLNPVAGLEVSACDVCVDKTLTSSGYLSSGTGTQPVCVMTLNTRFVRAQAERAHVPVRMLTAMAMLHEQELCLGGREPYATEQRLAAKLGNPRLLNVLYAQIDTRRDDWNTVAAAVAILRDHGELAFQRRAEIRRRHLDQVGPLWITACRGCLRKEDLIGQASFRPDSDGVIGCDVVLDLTGLEREARDWGLPTNLVVATILVHEQEHCVRGADDRETPAIDEERRLALKVGGARLLEFVGSFYRQLDRRGYWKS